MHVSRIGRDPYSWLTDFSLNGDNPDEIVIPDDLTDLSDEALADLAARTAEAFADIYGDGSNVSDEGLVALTDLAAGSDALRVEIDSRAEAAAERSQAAAELASRINPGAEGGDDGDADGDEAGSAEAADSAEGAAGDETDGDDETDESGDPADDARAGVDEQAAQTVTAGAGADSHRRRNRVPLGGLRRRPGSTGTPSDLSALVAAAPDIPGYASGQRLDVDDLGRAIQSRLGGVSQSTLDRAADSGRHIRQQMGIATITRPMDDRLRVASSNYEDAERAMAFATDQARLPGGSLVASGGWCAPSEVLYDLFPDMETRDGIVSLPEIGITRGGVWVMGSPSFADIFGMDNLGFHYTEAEDISGAEYPKPCLEVDCPEPTEHRLELDGICISAGLLQRKAYPEYIARIVRGAMVAHAHKIAGTTLSEMVAGSTAVTMPAGQVGAAAPLLTAIELQATHYRTTHRMNESAVLEGILPNWVRGAVRADLARRQGVDLIDVPNSRVDAWFRARGINPQFVYNWQGVDGTAAGSFTAWPSSVQFLLYSAGTWVRGTSDVITLDTLIDTNTLATNDYTALFTEEGSVLIKRGVDSRVVTVPICANGATHGGVDIDCDGSAVVVDEGTG